MTEEELIKQCRYYSGKEDGANPFTGNLSWFWDMERVYVESEGDFDGEDNVYKYYGGREYPGIPHPLLMVMFTSWGKCGYLTRDSLEIFYKLIDEYLDIASDHYPTDKIPGGC